MIARQTLGSHGQTICPSGVQYQSHPTASARGTDETAPTAASNARPRNTIFLSKLTSRGRGLETDPRL